jgi:hypothetical protein
MPYRLGNSPLVSVVSIPTTIPPGQIRSQLFGIPSEHEPKTTHSLDVRRTAAVKHISVVARHTNSLRYVRGASMGGSRGDAAFPQSAQHGDRVDI